MGFDGLCWGYCEDDGEERFDGINARDYWDYCKVEVVIVVNNHNWERVGLRWKRWKRKSINLDSTQQLGKSLGLG